MTCGYYEEKSNHDRIKRNQSYTPLHKCIIQSRWLGDKLLTRTRQCCFFFFIESIFKTKKKVKRVWSHALRIMQKINVPCFNIELYH